MNQWSTFNFALTKKFEQDGKELQRQYVFELQPGAPWEEIQAVLDDFKVEFKQLHEQVLKQEADKASQPVVEAQPSN